MSIRLIYKFIIGYAAAILIGFIAISYGISAMSYNTAVSNEAEKLYKEAVTISTNYCNNYYAGTLSLQDLNGQLSTLNSYNGGSIMLVSVDGTIVADTTGVNVNTVCDFDPTDNGNKNYIIGDFYGLFSSSQVSAYYPVEYNYVVRGYIVVSRLVSAIRNDSESLFNYNYITMIICYVLTLALVVLFMFNISAPLKKITESTNLYAKGDFSKKIKLGRSDEIGMLADSLDYMADEISTLNDYQNKFISNVSHDFRSPLTSIKGYLEAMLDGTIPPEMQEKYLKIVIAETERLTKLTNNLLTLNTVSQEGMLLDITDFNIVDIIKQTIGTFEGVCEKKKIKFKLVLSDKNLMVTADQGKIQQVIYNLVDNAIKFSSTDSSIMISTREKGDKLLISVKDFGIGIPKESLPKIWDRFYKSDLSRGKDKKGTGLGLSIVKGIINAHKEYIDVVSTEGVGTEFTFALPKAKVKNNFELLSDD